MSLHRRTVLTGLIALPGLVACAPRLSRRPAGSNGRAAGDTPELSALIRRYAQIHDIPESLLRRVIERESGYDPSARNGPYYGLMQILPQTAATMGYRGPPEGLLDAETNLRYAGRYLRGAWIVANGSEDRAMMWYSKGYYYEAKRRGLLVQTGLTT